MAQQQGNSSNQPNQATPGTQPKPGSEQQQRQDSGQQGQQGGADVNREKDRRDQSQDIEKDRGSEQSR